MFNTSFWLRLAIEEMNSLVLRSEYSSPAIEEILQELRNCPILREGIAKNFYSFISPVGHNIWWENSRNGPFGPKNDPKTQIWPFLRSFLGSKFGTIPSGGGQNSMHHSFGGGPEFGTIPSGGGQNLEPFLRGRPEFGTIPSGGGQNSSGQISIY